MYKLLNLRYQEKKIQYINSTMKLVNDMWTDVYESLLEDDFDNVDALLTEIKMVIEDLTKSISNEI